MKRTLGAVIAGGQSTRFGSPKALAEVGGRRVVDRVIDALREVVPDVVAIANEESIGHAIGLPFRADVRPDLGAIGGIHAALLWARERKAEGVLAAGCDMPFLSPSLLSALCDAAAAGGADAVLPESDGPRGIEPLCAWYACACLPAIERALDRGDRRMIGFHGEIRVLRLPAANVRLHGDPATLFLNLNTQADRQRADHLARTSTDAQ